MDTNPTRTQTTTTPQRQRSNARGNGNNMRLGEMLLLLLLVAGTCSVASAATAAPIADQIDPSLVGVLDEYGPVNASRGESVQDWDDILQALNDYQQEADVDAIYAEAVPFYGNDSVVLWEPPIETMLYKGTNDTDDVMAVYVRVIHEILSNMTLYGGDVVLENLLDVYGQKPMASTFMALLNMGLPTADEMIVRMWKTNLVSDAVNYFASLMSDQLNPETGNPDDPTSGITAVLEAFFSDYDSIVWKDLTVVMGKPLGPSIIPFLKNMAPPQNASANATSAANDEAKAEELKKRTDELFPKFLDSLRLLGIKNLLYNPYLPIPCIKDDPYCPVIDEDYTRAFAQSYDLASRGKISEERFAYDFQDALFQYFNDFGSNLEIGDILGGIVNNNTERAGRILSQDETIDNHLPQVLNNLSDNTYALAMTEEAAASGYDARLSVCMANISSAMYESPETRAKWLEGGLGLELVDSFPMAGDLSSMGSVYVDRGQNAVVFGIEGIPVIHKYFQRGFFGWLSALVNGGTNTQPFRFPCSEIDFKGNNSICAHMGYKYYDTAEIYPGFAPLDDVMVTKLKPALQKAVLILEGSHGGSENATSTFREAKEKPKLYITGHSLGGPLAKHSLAQILLREYDQMFSSITAYAFGGAMAGNDAYLSMVDEMLDSPLIVPTKLFQVVNSYDPWPYIPAVFGSENGSVQKGNVTLIFDLEKDELAKEEPLRPFKGMPANVFLSFEGVHAPKTQYVHLLLS